MNKIFYTIVVILGLLATSISANEPQTDTSTVRYGQSYFAKFQPVTVIDMINKIPGGIELLKSASGNGGRGFGANGSQILIDGKRMSGKANNMSKTLSLILASQVDHIRLMRGTADGLDVRSEGQMLNVILKSGDESGSSNLLSVSTRYIFNEELIPSKLYFSHNAKSEDFKYSISYQYHKNIEAKDVPEDVFNSDGIKREFRQGRWKETNKNHLITGNLGYTFINGDIINLNAYYSDNNNKDNKVEEQFLLDTDESLIFDAIEDKEELYQSRKWEIGGDYESSLDSVGLLKALFIISKNISEGRDTDYLILDGGRIPEFTYSIDPIQEERIFRSSILKRFNTVHSLEYGLEAAFNQLDKTTTIDTEPTQNTLVSEDRYELFLTHSWTISPEFSSQFSLIEEFSKIQQVSSEINNSRSYQYLKPRLELRYDITDQKQLRFVADHSVSQLNLGNFIVSRNEEDETIDLGNPDLVPYKRWLYSMGYEQQLDNNTGSIEAKFYYEDITDHIDKIQIGELSSGVGNIGDAYFYGLELNANVRLGFLGLQNALVTTTYRFRDSETTDPFTGNKRPMKHSSKHFWNFDYRHDVTKYDLSYGFNFHKRSPMYRNDISLFEERTFKYHFKLFVDYFISPSVKLQMAYNHPLRDRKLWNKTFYEGHISDGIIDYLEKRIEHAEPDIIINLQMAF